MLIQIYTSGFSDFLVTSAKCKSIMQFIFNYNYYQNLSPLSVCSQKCSFRVCFLKIDQNKQLYESIRIILFGSEASRAVMSCLDEYQLCAVNHPDNTGGS